MSYVVATGPVRHFRLTATDVVLARAFDADVLGFALVTEPDPGVFLSNGSSAWD